MIKLKTFIDEQARMKIQIESLKKQVGDLQGQLTEIQEIGLDNDLYQ